MNGQETKSHKSTQLSNSFKKPELFNVKIQEKIKAPLFLNSNSTNNSVLEKVEDFDMVLKETCEKVNETFVTD